MLPESSLIISMARFTASLHAPSPGSDTVDLESSDVGGVEVEGLVLNDMPSWE